MNNELADCLNAAGVRPELSGLKIVAFEDRSGNTVSLKSLGVASGGIEEHPEGSGRGGYVPTVHGLRVDPRYKEEFGYKETAYFDENLGEWL